MRGSVIDIEDLQDNDDMAFLMDSRLKNMMYEFDKDMKSAATMLTAAEARFLVDSYYSWQESRITQAHRIRTSAEQGEPNRVILYQYQQTEIMEERARLMLNRYAKSRIEGEWLMSICGIGPVIAAGLMCHIDIEKAPTAGHIWSFAGLDPTKTWEKGQKRPWNASLKRLCFLIGESFVKVSGRDKDVYGKFYRSRKAYEEAKNESKDYAEQATASLERKRYSEDTKARACYEEGKLPPARIHRRSARWATKLFLSHYQTVAWYAKFGNLPPEPFPIGVLGHAHMHVIPNTDMVPGLTQALRDAGRQ